MNVLTEPARSPGNVSVIPAGPAKSATNAWKIPTVCTADAWTHHFNASVMTGTRVLAAKSQYAVKAAILNM